MRWQNATETTLNHLVEQPRLGLITDMDGTISPIVADPDSAQVTARNRILLNALCKKLPLVAVISGRAVMDVRARVGIPRLTYIGNHGFERWADGLVRPVPEVEAYTANVAGALSDIRRKLAPGMRVEDKRVTLSVHYRQTENPEQIVQDYKPVMENIARRYELVLYQGRMVFEFRPPLKVNKGTALTSIISDYALDACLYLGDDTTDVDAFKATRTLREQNRCYALAIGVESDGTPEPVRDNSDFLVSGVSGVEEFLAWLLESRSASFNWV